MNYHNITKDDMNNGDGLRVVLWVSGCEHRCPYCQNPQTWNKTSGIYFDKKAENELYEELRKPYTSGITFSGGDPLALFNRETVFKLIKKIKKDFPNKSIWLYTGYLWEDIKDLDGIEDIDVVLEGPFIQDLKDNNAKWVGSTNQRVINVKESLNGNIVRQD